MVLADLGRKLNAALSALNRAPVVDEKVIHTKTKYLNISNIFRSLMPHSRKLPQLFSNQTLTSSWSHLYDKK